jgi:hypothetical protein
MQLKMWTAGNTTYYPNWWIYTYAHELLYEIGTLYNNWDGILKSLNGDGMNSD